MVDLTALRFDLGPAWLNLLGSVGTAYGPDPIERLTGPARLAEWLAGEGLTPAERGLTDADVTAARELREALRALMLAAVGGRAADPAAIATLNRFLSYAEPLAIAPNANRQGAVEGAPCGPAGGGAGAGSPVRVVPPRTARAALARVAQEAAGHLGGTEAGHLHQCADDGCRAAFLDPGGRRRWCSTERCGVKSRVRAHRARRQAAR